jgi:hypothetical protein
MSFHTTMFSSGVLLPDEIKLIQTVFDDIVREDVILDDPSVREQFAKYVISIYERGMCDPDKLRMFCRIAAKHKFCRVAVNAGDRQTA